MFITNVEASFTPTHHFQGRDPPISDYHNTKNPPPIDQVVMPLIRGWDPTRCHDVFELCAGAAITSVILISRRRFKVGPNFDLVIGMDLLDTKQEQAFWKYLEVCKPVVVVMSTP